MAKAYGFKDRRTAQALKGLVSKRHSTSLEPLERKSRGDYKPILYIIRWEIPDDTSYEDEEDPPYVLAEVKGSFPAAATKVPGEDDDQEGRVRIYDPTEHYLDGEDAASLDGRTGYAILMGVRDPTQDEEDQEITYRFEFLTMDCG